MQPVKKYSAGGLQVAVWENESKTGGKFHTVSMDRSYKDNKDNWQKTNTLRVNDIPKAVVALTRAYEFAVLKEPTIAD